jgi:hypothetical protein
MPIRMRFPNPLDSPTGRAEVRLRWGMHRRDGATVPVMTYRAATAIELTREAWAGYREAGVTIEADTDREKQIVREALDVS